MPESYQFSNVLNFPILSLITFLPLAGAIIIIFFMSKEKENLIKWFANIVAFADMAISFVLIPYFESGTLTMQFSERYKWIPQLGVEYLVGIDGISYLLLLLTTILGFIAILSSWSSITTRIKEYYVFMLILQTGMLGVFVALDFVLFYIFWEVMLVPMYFLIGVWGGPRKLYAAIKFFLYTFLGSVLMLLGILTLYFYNQSVTGTYTFNILELMKIGLPAYIQYWVFLAFFIGFAIKVPMFPFHTWLPDAHVEAPTAGSVILAGVLLKMGTYGFVRFALPFFPEATVQLLPWMLALSVIGIVYGALVAMMQPDMKKLIAYSSVSHLGFCMLGVFVLNEPGINGAVMQMLNHGISTGALFLIVGLIYERRHTRMIKDLGGLSARMPVYAAIYAIITMSSIGLPGLNGFIGEFLILQGTWLHEHYWWLAFFAATGMVLGAAYMLWLYQRVMFGKAEGENEHVVDLNLREKATLIPLVVLAFWIGIY
ncbi:MAG TPA: NADH-quinone oxidoreductase subunit M, partial [Acidobacteriota bacterium]|nr:NADH-quinone oxidoreductase subunit M [Acidobacteriota bacterium]